MPDCLPRIIEYNVMTTLRKLSHKYDKILCFPPFTKSSNYTTH